MSLPKKLVAINDHPTNPTIWYVKENASDLCEVAVCFADDDGFHAKFLAAAPDLLAALEAALPILKKRHASYSLQNQVEEAICKARGESREPSTPLGEILADVEILPYGDIK